MQNPAQDSAMTEVALALAMGFFSLMVLTLISMGSGPEGGGRESDERRKTAALDLIMPAGASGPATETSDKDILVFFDGSTFLDSSLVPRDPDAIARQALSESRRVVLAVDPGLSLERTMALRQRLKAPDLVVTAFGPDWRARLAQGGTGHAR